MYYFYYFPVGTETRLRRVPIVTMGLAATLLFVHYLLYYFKPTVHLYSSLVLSIETPSLVQAFSACFVHGGLFHLVGNLLYLLTFGPGLEDRIGRWAFLGFYLVAGLVSMLVQVEILQTFPEARRPLYILGASGAISGILGMYGVRCWFLKVRIAHATFAYFQGVTQGGISLVPAWVALGAWSVLQAVYTLVSLNTESTGVAYWSHTSGLALGLVAGLALGMMGQGHRERRLVQATRYMEAGSWYAALGEYQGCAAAGGYLPEAKLGEARSLRLLGRKPQALEAYREALAILIEEENWVEARAAIQEVRRMSDRMRLPADSVSQVADVLFADGDFLHATELYELAGCWGVDPARGADLLKRAGDIARTYLGDLKRAASDYGEAARSLAEVEVESRDQKQIGKLKEQNKACLRVLAKRVRFAAQTV